MARAHVESGDCGEVTALLQKALGSADSEENAHASRACWKRAPDPLQALLADLLIWLNPAPVRRASRFACLLALA